jgi:hypothetical protein
MKLSIHQEGHSVLLQWTTDEENGAFIVNEASDPLPRGEAGFKARAEIGTLWHPTSELDSNRNASAGDPLINTQIAKDSECRN